MVCDLDIDYFFLEPAGRYHERLFILLLRRSIPVPEPAHTFCQISPSLELRVYDCADIDFGKSMAD